jgi:hypothetical protein
VSSVAGYELADLLALRELSRDQLQARFGALETDPDVGYERISGVDRLHDPAAFPGHFYFHGEDLQMLYVPRSALADADLDELERELGEPAAKLRSRTGEDSSLFVYPDHGVAFATDAEHIEILEIFPPTTLDEYVSGIYKDPGDFIR